MASQQCCKPAQHSQHQKHQKHDQHQQDHCFGHVSDKIKGVFQGHHHAQGPPVAHGHGPVTHGHSGHGSAAGHCKPAGLKKKEHRKKKEGGLLHKIKEAFSDHSDSSDSSDDECHKRKN